MEAGGMRIGAIDAITERLSGYADLYLPHSVFPAREEPVTQTEKKQHLVDLLHRDSAIFLERYGSSLLVSELQEFDIFQDNYEINWHLKRLKAKLDPSPEDRKNKAAEVRNRRLAYMENLIDGGSYFSEDEMRMRSPLLHHEYLGQFQDQTTRGVARPGEKFAEMLGRQVDEAFIQQKLRDERREAGIVVVEDVSDFQGEFEEEEDSDDEAMVDKDNPEDQDNLSMEINAFSSMQLSGNGSQSKDVTKSKMEDSSRVGGRDPQLEEFSRRMESEFMGERVACSSEEMKEKLDDFTKVMQEKFLNGEDSDHVDYGKIDSDSTLDDHWLKQVSQDAEAKYFEDDF